MPEFVTGLALAERFYREQVRPLVEGEFAGLLHSAALLGEGSEVLGFDSELSTDHDWGPRTLLFLRGEDHTRYAGAIHDLLRRKLPPTFLGWSTSFSAPDAADGGTQSLAPALRGDVRHRVGIYSARGFCLARLGVDPEQPLSASAWLSLPSQKLLSLTAGAIFHDGVGLDALRARLRWYPHDVWLYLLAAGWTRIGQEEHLMGRAGHAGDELGAHLIAARLVRDVMRLCFLMQRQYAPYAKWFGSAFARLRASDELSPLLRDLLAAGHWRTRDNALSRVLAATARLHNALALTEPLSTEPRPFHARPFAVIDGERFARALRERIEDAEVVAIPNAIGGIDQWSDSTDLLEAVSLRERCEGLYRPPT